MPSREGSAASGRDFVKAGSGNGTTLRIPPEKILRLSAGEDAPPGMEIVRIEGTCEGDDTELVYVVAVRPTVTPTSEQAFTALELAMKVEDGTADPPDVEALVRCCRVLARGMA